MRKLLPLIFLFISISSFSQQPLIKEWDKTFGGTSDETLAIIKQTKDGGYILGGYSSSGIGGDKTQNLWGSYYYDFWIVKTDALGNKKWDKRFGGTDYDVLYSLQQTTDGGYILGGYSSSQIGGDKTADCRGSSDYWIVKIDSLGNMQWDKRYGGTNSDILNSLQQTSDGGYILGGYSSSDIGGDKTNTYQGSYDFWIVKTDALGNKQWDKTFGGTSSDRLYSLQQTTDGGYILGGYSSSGIGGDKTQISQGSYDYWIIKTDALGNKQWDKVFGGTSSDYLFSLQQTTDKGFILGGYSSSGIGGDKTQASQGGADFWIVKTDSLGGKQWDKRFGGTDYDDSFGNISQTLDGGFVFAGTSYSGLNGDKTENNLGYEQTWIVRIDSAGNKVWDKTVFTNGHEEYGFVIQTSDGGYLAGNNSNAISGGYKTDNSRGSSYGDYWVVKFADSSLKVVPHANFKTNDTLICAGDCINFTNISPQYVNYQWSFPGATPSSASGWNPSSVCYNTPGKYDVRLIAKSSLKSDTLLLKKYVTVNPSPVAGNATSNPGQICAGESSVLKATGSLGALQWQSSSDGISFTDIAGANDSTYLVANYLSTVYFREKVSLNLCERFSKVLKIIVPHQPKGGIVKGPDSLCAGNYMELSVTGTVGTIQWQFSTDGVSFSPIAGATTADYNSYPLVPIYYRVKVTTPCGVDFSPYKLVKVITNTVAGTISGPDSICSGSKLQLTITGNVGDIQWQFSANGTSFSNINGAKNSIYVGYPSLTTYYRVKITNACGENYSPVKTISMMPKSIAGIVSALRDTICAGTPASLSVTGNSGAVQWQSSVTNGDFTILNHATSTSFLDIPLKSTFYRVFTGVGQCSDTSAPYKIFVMPSPEADYSFDSSGLKVIFNSAGSSGDVTIFSWDFGDSTSSTDPSPSHTFSRPDTFHVCLTVYNGSNCTYTICKDINVQLGTALLNLKGENTWHIYPNPAGEFLIANSTLSHQHAEMEIYNLIGEEIYNSKVTDGQVIAVRDLTPGIYYVRLKWEGKDEMIKLVIVR